MIIATSTLTTPTSKPTTSTSSATATNPTKKTTATTTTNNSHTNEFIPLKLMSSAMTTTAATSSTATAAKVNHAAAAAATAANGNNEFNKEKAVDLVTVQHRHKGPDDFITKVFGADSLYDNQVTELLNIQSTSPATCAVSTNQNATLLLSCEAFIHDSIVFLSIPLLMMDTNNSNSNINCDNYNNHNTSTVFEWPTADFQSSISHLIELAEEKTGCSALVVCIDKRNYNRNSMNGLNIVLRAFMYLGFELVHPSVYHHDQTNYVLVGYEL